MKLFTCNPLLALILIKVLLAHGLIYLMPQELRYLSFRVYLSVYPIVVLYVMFRWSEEITKLRRNVLTHVLFYTFLVDCIWSAIERINSYYVFSHKMFHSELLDTSYLIASTALLAAVILAIKYRIKFDYTSIVGDTYDTLTCYVACRFPKTLPEFYYCLKHSTPCVGYCIVLNGYVYYSDNSGTSRYKLKDPESLKLVKVSYIAKTKLRQRLDGYNKTTNPQGDSFIEDIMGFPVQHYFKCKK